MCSTRKYWGPFAALLLVGQPRTARFHHPPCIPIECHVSHPPLNSCCNLACTNYTGSKAATAFKAIAAWLNHKLPRLQT